MIDADHATVLGHSVERKRGTVLVLFRTDRGAVRLRFTHADAHMIGGEIRVAGVARAGERREETRDKGLETRDPILKPGGGIL